MIQFTSTNSNSPSPISGMLSSASDVALDIMEVGELQLHLARLDAKTALGRSVVAFSLVIGGGAIITACLPLVALAVAGVLSNELDWEPWFSQMVVGLLSTCIGSFVVIIGVYRLRLAITAFERTSTEFTNNVSWLKQLVRGLKSSHLQKF
ncbi:MAG: phage holin family protein [Planctomycetota bacterium]|nr:phage holin family protein [Planctomycetota bacterium]